MAPSITRSHDCFRCNSGSNFSAKITGAAAPVMKAASSLHISPLAVEAAVRLLPKNTLMATDRKNATAPGSPGCRHGAPRTLFAAGRISKSSKLILPSTPQPAAAKGPIAPVGSMNPGNHANRGGDPVATRLHLSPQILIPQVGDPRDRSGQQSDCSRPNTEPNRAPRYLDPCDATKASAVN